MININYVKGDATNPQGKGTKFICHICNDIGAWGAGFVLALSKKWKEPERLYRNMASKNEIELGTNGYAWVNNKDICDDHICVINMVAQHGCGYSNGKPPIRYDALEKCLEIIKDSLLKNIKSGFNKDCSVHMPRIGCGLAGGKWGEVERIIVEKLSKNDIPVFVYDLE